MTTLKESPYEVLGVAKSATTDEIQRAYRALAKQLHTDTGGGDEEGMKRLNEAHDVLSDPDKRAEYDKEIASKAAQRAAEERQQWAEAVRDARRPSSSEAQAFADSLGGTGGGRPRTPPRSTAGPGSAPSPRPPREPPPRPSSAPLPKWPAPPPRAATRPRPSPAVSAEPILRSGVGAYVGGVFSALGVLIGALGLLALPFGIEALWAPIFNKNQHDLLVDLVGLAIGLGCLGLLLTGLYFTVIAIGALFASLFNR